ncbi:MAG TPA: transglycosylase SLT domain-containing protein [Blastocatellia bacterium]|nr:transglycosylase SLT domain-containing protein [Blastocatellia bacterium]
MVRAVVVYLSFSLATLAQPFPLLAAAREPTLKSAAAEIRAAMDARELDRAERLARGLRTRDAEGFARNNFDYLLARLAERRGESLEASSLYQAVLDRKSVLAEYALWRLAGIARASRDLALERQYLTRLLASHAASALAGRSRERIIDSLRESGDYRATIAMLRGTASASGVQGRRAMFKLAEAHAKTGDTAVARSLFDQLVSGSRDDYALAAAEALDALDRASRAKPNEFEALRRARIYLANRHWSEARSHLTDITARFPESVNLPEALYQTGFSFFREENYDEAIKWFERVHTEFPDKKEGEQGYYWVASSLQKAKRYEAAARRYGEFIDAYPDSELLEGAYRNVVDCLRYAGKDAEAREWSRRITDRFAGQPLAIVGLFNEAKIDLTRGNYEAALTLLTRLQVQPAPSKLIGGPMRGEAAFLRFYTLEQMGRLDEAARGYLATPDDRDSYFGHRATLRLKALWRTDEGRAVLQPIARAYRDQARRAFAAGRYSEAKDAAGQALRLADNAESERALVDILRGCYAHLPAYSAVSNHRLLPVARGVLAEGDHSATDTTHRALAAELMFLGLYDEGATELRLGGLSAAAASVQRGLTRNAARAPGAATARTASTKSAPGDVAYSLAVYSNRGDQSYYAISFAEPAFKSIPQDYCLELLPRDLIEMLYPAPYRESLTRYGLPLKVDSRLILALARQESRFNPTVKSPAAARGLLQFIPETAMKLARADGGGEFDLDDLYDPNTSIRLATRYIADMQRMFAGHTYAVIAAYNTGEANVERWIYRARSNDVDRMMAEIAIPETKDYFAKVMLNLRAYQQLYPADLKPRKP